MSSRIAEQLETVKNEIGKAAAEAGRKTEDVKLVAVSKTYPSETVMLAYDAGQRVFGENRVQELEEKAEVMPKDIQWHLIGHLQSNKAQKAVKYADYIHSVDSVKLLKRLDKIAGESSKKPKILLEINVSGEESKFGTTDNNAALNLAAEAVSCENLEFRGLMTMAPFGADEDELKEVFSGLRKLRDEMEKKFSVSLPELSMGMSSDFEAAIAEGATYVRIGTAIFGNRSYK